MYKVRKKFKFESAHVLDSSYSLDCQRRHGHSYVLEVFLKSKTLNSDGMVMDFGELKDIVNPLIKSFDHMFIMSESYYLDNPSELGKSDVIVLEDNPTAENMARIFFNNIKEDVPQLYKIRLHETETGWAEYSE